jgi:hypothetical protein
MKRDFALQGQGGPGFLPPFSKGGQGEILRQSENPPKSPFFKGGLFAFLRFEDAHG